MSNQESPSTLSFREFLQSKADEFGVRDRHRRRKDWLGTLNRLLGLLQGWLRESDPEGLLDIEPYEVARTEPGLGGYDAPALKIRFGPAEVDVVPMSSRGSDIPRFEVALDASNSLAAEPPFEGRVDVTEGYRKYILYRQVRDGDDHWLIRNERNQFTPLDSESFARILQDLLS